MAAFRGADRPRAARIAGPRRRRVVRALAVRPADRVDRRQVEHVEAQSPRRTAAAPRRSRSVPCRPGSAPSSAGTARTRSRSGQHGIDDDWQLVIVARAELPDGVTLHRPGQVRREDSLSRLGVVVPQHLSHGPQRRAVAGRRCPGRLLDQLGADQEVDPDVLPGVEPLAQVARQDLKRSNPADQRVAGTAQVRHLELPAPAVVEQRRHRRLDPGVFALATVEQDERDGVVTVSIGVGLDDDGFADRPLDRETPAVNLRADPLDHDPAASVLHACPFPDPHDRCASDARSTREFRKRIACMRRAIGENGAAVVVHRSGSALLDRQTGCCYRGIISNWSNR